MIPLIVSGLLFGAIASSIARQKGRGEVLWFVLGFVLHLFGLVVLFLPPVCKSGITKKCTACAEIVKAEANVCRYCGKDLIAVGGEEVS